MITQNGRSTGMIGSITNTVRSPWTTQSAAPTAAPAPPPAPRDSVELQAAAAPSAPRASLLSRVGRGIGIAVALACVGTTMTGCGRSIPTEQLGPPVASQTVQADQQQAMRFEVVPNAVRVDVIRQTHEETDCHTDSDGDTHCTTKTEDDPYQPVGVYLGHGLYLDAGLNLSVVPDRVWHGPIVPQDFSKITIQGPFGSWSRSTVSQEGNTVGISQRFNFFDNQVVRDNKDQTTIKLGTFKSMQRFNNIVITRNGENIDVQAWAPNVDVLKAMQRVEIRVNGNEVTVHPFGPKSLVDTRITYSGDRVTVQPFGGRLSRTDITKRGEVIRVDHFGPGHAETQRGQNGMNESGSALGFTARGNVKIDGNRYDVNEPGLFGHSTITVEK